MPIYGYDCRECGHALDALQKISDPPLIDCPACGKPALKRQLSAPRFRLKGQGWYETDFKKDRQRNLAGDGEAAKAEGKEGAESKPEAKPDGKADAKPDKAAPEKPAEPKPAKAAKAADKGASKTTGGDAG